MKKILLPIAALLCLSMSVKAQSEDSTNAALDSLEASFKYETGIIPMATGNGQIEVPPGFRFLDAKQSQYLLSELWGNPEDTTILGMLMPENGHLFGNDSWAFTISYDEMGYVKDDDAKDIDYKEMLKDQQKEVKESNKERIEQGYEPISFINWAANPFYDKEKKTLHWAKELKFGSDSMHTLNYNVRVLGRKGIFLINAVASMNDLPVVQSNINKIISSVSFNKSNRYADFEPGTDNIAAWTVGGLVAGKVLAKVGFFAVLLKFWKLIALAVMGGGSAIWNFVRGKRKQKDAEGATAEQLEA